MAGPRRRVGKKVGSPARKAARGAIKGISAYGRLEGKVIRGAIGAVKSDLASGRQRRATKMAATRTKADASAKLAQRKKQKATRSRIAARKRTGRGTGGG